MKKILLVFIFAILLLGSVSAVMKSYDEETKTVTIKSNILFIPTGTIASATLDTPLIYRVGAGYGKVAQITMNPNKDYDSIIERFDLYDLNDNEKGINREIDIKYLTIEQVEVDEYQPLCINKLYKNLSTYQECNNIKIGSHLEDREIWNDFDGNVKKDEPLIIGLFTNIEVGDKIEWVPTIAGIGVDEWAVWTAALNIGLEHYYTYDIVNATWSGTYDNITETYNKRILNNSIGAGLVAGKIGNGLYLANENYSTIINTIDYNNSYTDNFWAQHNWTAGANNLIYQLSTTIGGADTDLIINNMGNGTLEFDGGGTIAGNITVQNSTMTMYTITANSTWFWVYVNGTLAYAGANSTADLSARYLDMPRKDVSGQSIIYDEHGHWNRTLTSDEITYLYNEGAGVTYEKAVRVNLMSPINNENITTNTINFIGNVTDDFSFGIKNVSLLINGTLNQTNTSTFDGIYNFTVDVPYGFWNWTLHTYDDLTNLITPTNDTLNFSVAPTFFNSYTYNAFSAETQNETFTANISSNGTAISNTWLYYNGSTYSAETTNTAGNYYNLTREIDIPIGFWNRTFAFNYTLSGANYSTPLYQQNISETLFTSCNATYSDDFLNITFRDEATLSDINASIPTSTFTYYLGSGLINKTYTYVNNSNNYNYTFCGTQTDLNVLLEVQYKQGTDYPQRIWEPVLQNYNSTIFEQVLYLLGSADGLYVTFQVQSNAEQPIADVEANSTREIGGATVVVGTGTTGDDGGVTFWVNPDFLHTFGFFKAGYDAFITSIFPTQSSYTILLGGGGATNVSDYTRGITYTILPSTSTILTNETDYSFNFSLASDYWNVEEFGFSLSNSSGSITNTTSALTNGGILNIILNTNVSSSVTMNYYWIISGNYTNASVSWTVWDSSGSGYGLTTFFNNLKTYLGTEGDRGLFGLTDWGLGLIIFFVIFLSVGALSYKFGLNSPPAIMGIIFGMVFFFDVAVELIPNPVGAVPYFPTIFIGILTVAAIFWEAKR